MEKMKIVFHDMFYNSDYSIDPAAAQGRLEGIMDIINSKSERYEVVAPEAASDKEILRAHTNRHLEDIKRYPLLYEMSALAAGGAIMAARLAFEGSPAFAVIRPPGHHASSDSCWGFCFFNNMAISLLSLFAEKKIRSAFVLDFDLHTGDGNINILERRRDGFAVNLLNPMSRERRDYIKEVEKFMKDLRNIDIFAASAGFDQGISDWGNLLSEEDYERIGSIMKTCSERVCSGRRYALLEGGYSHSAIGLNTDAFCGGFR